MKCILSNRCDIISIKVLASDTAQVTNMKNMFLGCKNLIDLIF